MVVQSTAVLLLDLFYALLLLHLSNNFIYCFVPLFDVIQFILLLLL